MWKNLRAQTKDLKVVNGVWAPGIEDNGIMLFSSYSPKIWEARPERFRKQSQFGLLGELDKEKSSEGTIVWKDGFRATIVSSRQFVELFDEFGLNASIIEVDESSIFCEVIKEK